MTSNITFNDRGHEAGPHTEAELAAVINRVAEKGLGLELNLEDPADLDALQGHDLEEAYDMINLIQAELTRRMINERGEYNLNGKTLKIDEPIRYEDKTGGYPDRLGVV